MSTYHLEYEQLVHKPLSEVFQFFSEAQNLQRLTPEFLHFEILTPLPITMGVGTLIDYRIRLAGVPMRWRTRIEEFIPEQRFVDVQLEGPYKKWHHLHEFVAVDGGTLVRDRVTYQLPFGPLGVAARALVVRHTLRKIFDFRREAIASFFA